MPKIAPRLQRRGGGGLISAGQQIFYCSSAFISYTGGIEEHLSLLNLVLDEQPVHHASKPTVRC